MADFINTIDVIGDDVLTRSIVDGSVIEFCDNAVTSIGNYAFRECSALATADLPAVTSVGSYAFRSCSSLATVILRNTAKVATLDHSNAFNGTPIASGTGYIYVPRSLVDSYKTATIWSTYANQFRALEDYTVDGTTTGELDHNKI